MKHTKPFRVRAKKAIAKAVELRLFLIQTGKSKNGITHDHCNKILNDLMPLQSDRLLAKYLIDNFQIIESMMPGPHKSSKRKLNELNHEASKYLETWKMQ